MNESFTHKIIIKHLPITIPEHLIHEFLSHYNPIEIKLGKNEAVHNPFNQLEIL